MIVTAGLANNKSQFHEPITACGVHTRRNCLLKRFLVSCNNLFIFSAAGSMKPLDENSIPRTLNGFLLGRTHIEGFDCNFH